MHYYEIGKIVNTHGIKGEVRVLPVTDFAEERFQVGNTVYLFKDDNAQPIEVEIASVRTHKQFELLTFVGYENINLVEKFKGYQVKISEAQQEELEEGVYYHHQIIGLDVYDQNNHLVGQIAEIMETGANDVWVVKRHDKKELLLPAIPDVIQEIDLADHKVLVDIPEGLDD